MGIKAKKRQERKKLNELIDALSRLYVLNPEDVASRIAEESKEEFLFKASGLLSRVEGLSFKETWIEEAFANLKTIIELLE